MRSFRSVGKPLGGVLGGMMRYRLTVERLLQRLGYDIVYMLDEASGATIVNTGTAGTAGNATLLNAPNRVVGPTGGGYDFDAANHAIRLSDGTLKDSIEAATAQTISILWKPRTAGPSNSSHIASYDNADRRLFLNGGMTPRMRYAQATTTLNYTASTLITVDTVQWLHVVMASNVVAIYTDAGTLAEVSYTNETPGAGAITSSATNLFYGNRGALDLAVNAEVYLIAHGRNAINPAQLNNIGRLTPGLG